MSSAEAVNAETPDLKVKKKKTKVDSGKKKDPLKKKRKAEAAVNSEAGSPEVRCWRPKHAQSLPMTISHVPRCHGAPAEAVARTCI